MRTSFRSITAFLVATFISLASLAAEADIAVTDAIVRAVPPGTPNTAAYMTIRNGSATDRKLIRVNSPVAKTGRIAQRYQRQRSDEDAPGPGNSGEGQG